MLLLPYDVCTHKVNSKVYLCRNAEKEESFAIIRLWPVQVVLAHT